ncbi:rhomboid-domain-containing protein [Neocallimastix lanati (nom. inval.)]|jgi:membrane associated rhomboid family serine protease|nr:rhomboid-domain-containing protein [Neocallimastix sp. JGI-2020a]
MSNDIRRKSTYLRKSCNDAWKWISAEDENVSFEQPVGYSFYQRNSTYKQMRQNKGTSTHSNSVNYSFLNQSYYKNLVTSEQSYSVDMSNIREEEEDENSVKRPEPAVEKAKNESNPNKRRNLKIPSALYDPEVIKQIKAMKKHTPFFMFTVTVIQVLLLGFCIWKNYLNSGKIIADINENPMLGPYPSILINMGARFIPCMYETNFKGNECPSGLIPKRNLKYIKINNQTYVFDDTFEKRQFIPDNNNFNTNDLNNEQNINTNTNINNDQNNWDNGQNNNEPIYINYNDNSNNNNFVQNSADSNIPGASQSKDQNYCPLADFCGMNMKVGDKPNQWYRFILPIFLHAGIIHLAFNLIFQIRTGFPMEKEYGTWRMFIIYMVSGIYGFIFEAKSAGLSPSVGCSGALYGLLACLLLDLIQSWKIIIKPWLELLKLLIIIIVSLGFGLIPYIDNFAHIGGFIMGLLMGIIFLPIIIFSKTGLIIKRILMVVSVFASIFLFAWSFKHFYLTDKVCKWCRYLSCIPIKEGWCNDSNTNFY